MRFMCSRDSLLEAIVVVQKAISTRSTLAILDGILIESTTTELIKLTGYNSEIAIEYNLHADVIEDVSMVINAKIFGEIIRKLPDDSVNISINDKFLVTIESGSSVFSISGHSSETYPKIPEVSNTQKITLLQNNLKDMIKQTSFAVSNDESRPVLNGSVFKSHENNFEVVAIDGFRLALRKLTLDHDLPSLELIIPGKILKEISSILSSKEDEVVIYASENHVMLDLGNIRVISRLIIGQYMDYQSILPKSSLTTLTVLRDLMLDAMERSALVVNPEDRRSPVRLVMTEDDVLVINADTERGKLTEEIPVQISGEKIDIDFNPRYFIDALKVIDDEEVIMYFNGINGPCLIKPKNGEHFAYLVLPLRK